MHTPLKKILQKADTMPSPTDRPSIIPHVSSPAPMARARSERAAAAAQHLEDVENEVNIQRSELMAANARIQLLDGYVQQLQSDLVIQEKHSDLKIANLERELRLAHQENDIVHTSLENCATLLLNLKNRLSDARGQQVAKAEKEQEAAHVAAQEFAAGDGGGLV